MTLLGRGREEHSLLRQEEPGRRVEAAVLASAGPMVAAAAGAGSAGSAEARRPAAQRSSCRTVASPRRRPSRAAARDSSGYANDGAAGASAGGAGDGDRRRRAGRGGGPSASPGAGRGLRASAGTAGGRRAVGKPPAGSQQKLVRLARGEGRPAPCEARLASTRPRGHSFLRRWKGLTSEVAQKNCIFTKEPKKI